MQTRVFPAAFSLVIAAVGCSSILQIEPGQLDVGKGGAASSSNGDGGSDGGVHECATTSDCPTPPFSECRAVTCAVNRCISIDAPAGTLTASQVSGDCQQIECDGHGLIRSVEVDDPRDDGRECTDDTCAQGVPMNTAKAPGTPCKQSGGAVCSGGGDCIGCLSDADCPGQICKGTVCVPMGCSDAVKDGGETDKDCGGPCNPCADGLHCVGAADCQSGVCKNKICKPPTCNDNTKNGPETDTDCGGPCPPCGENKTCGAPTDCLSGVCAGDVCCTPNLDVMTCLGRCGPITNNCDLTVMCGGCAPFVTCVQGLCVCVPDPVDKTCDNKCGLVANNCGQLFDCGPCPMAGP
jgi:hypothetical protein